MSISKRISGILALAFVVLMQTSCCNHPPAPPSANPPATTRVANDPFIRLKIKQITDNGSYLSVEAELDNESNDSFRISEFSLACALLRLHLGTPPTVYVPGRVTILAQPAPSEVDYRWALSPGQSISIQTGAFTSSTFGPKFPELLSKRSQVVKYACEFIVDTASADWKRQEPMPLRGEGECLFVRTDNPNSPADSR